MCACAHWALVGSRHCTCAKGLSAFEDMGKRYFCDYCERSFQDNMHNRKKHVYGVQHQRAKKAWFDHFRGSEDILKDEQAKRPCRKFLQTGICDFGTSCRFSHMSEADMYHLRKKVQDEKQRLEGSEDPNAPEPNVDVWLSNRAKRRSGQTGKSAEAEREEDRMPFDVPPQIFSIPDLPRSLVPPPPGSWKVNSDTEWG
ncbi:zinc finger matrin-type protein 5 isoform X2 [Corythoichthys intestinalis]|uniref:zinc finger matrin-type protein 5 isoform X2 n=1 Tax=Corythoichthys intestinalis TaxID=161448 RepID=UPI0025A64EED|nr:zinc finger matrin-type protein 5 isoform X2 [Corythoichthys intestinalis]